MLAALVFVHFHLSPASVRRCVCAFTFL